MNKIYTKTGDRGTTALVGGKRVRKTHERLEAYGTVDELNAILGWLVAELVAGRHADFLTRVQHRLFEVGAELATEHTEKVPPTSVIVREAVEEVEREIDWIQEELPPLRAFVLPGGDRKAAICHVARTVCRRAERAILRVAEMAWVADELLAYVNRLSDYLFVLARAINREEGKSEFFWEKS